MGLSQLGGIKARTYGYVGCLDLVDGKWNSNSKGQQKSKLYEYMQGLMINP